MGLKTRSLFLYGYDVSKNERFISIDEGSGEIVVEVSPSGYTFTELADALARALNDSGVNNYSVVANRSNRTFTITADAPFDILIATGFYAGSSLYTTLGFSGADLTGLMTYTSNLTTGSTWAPQLPLFSYSPSSNREGTVEATQSESGSGQIEVVSFGTVNYMECDAKFITNRIDKPDVIELDRNAVENAMAFLRYIRLKNRIEFMEDRDDVNNFEKFILSKTAASGNGLEVRLYEMTGQNLQDYFETQAMTFRKVT